MNAVDPTTFDALLSADRQTRTGYRLAAPRTTGDGHLIVEAVLAVPGVMQYPWGPTYVSADTLRDDEWLTSLRGVPVTDDDTGAHYDGVTPDTTERTAIGTVLGARWDDEQQAVIGEIVIDVRRGIDAVRSGVRGVSPAYRARYVKREGVDARTGLRYTHEQTKRWRADNVAVTVQPRGGDAAQLRGDSMADVNTEVEPEVEATTADADGMEKRLAALEAMVAEMADAYKAMSADMAKMKGADADPAKPDTADAEAAPAPAPVKVAPLRALFAAADAHGVEVLDDDTADALRARVAAKVLGTPVDGLSADALDVAIRLAPTKRAPTVTVTREAPQRRYLHGASR